MRILRNVKKCLQSESSRVLGPTNKIRGKMKGFFMSRYRTKQIAGMLPTFVFTAVIGGITGNVEAQTHTLSMTKFSSSGTMLALNLQSDQAGNNQYCLKITVSGTPAIVAGIGTDTTGSNNTYSTVISTTAANTATSLTVTPTTGANGSVTLTLDSNSSNSGGGSCPQSGTTAYVASTTTSENTVTHTFSPPTPINTSLTVDEEDEAAFKYNINLTASGSGNQSVTYSVSSDSTAEPEDYSLSAIAINGATASLTITIENDEIYEGDETIIIDLVASNAVFSNGGNTYTLTITITDDEVMPVLSIEDTSQSVTEGDSVTIRVKSSVQIESAISVGFTVTNISGGFFDAATSDPIPKRMTFKLVGSEFIGELTIGTRINSIVDSNPGEIRVVLDTPQSTDGYTIEDSAKTASISVVDDSVYVISVSAASFSVPEGEDIEIVLQSNPIPTNDLDVGLRVTQTGDNLVWPVRRSVRFHSGSRTVRMILSTIANPSTSSSGTVTVAVLDGDGYKSGNPVSVEVRKPAPGTVETTNYSVASAVLRKILNLPPIPTISIEQSHAATVVEAEGASLTYQFTLSGTVSGNESITHSISTDSTAESEDFSLSPIVFSGKTATLTITILNDSIYEGNEMAVIDLKANNAMFSDGRNTHKLSFTITDDEEKPVLSIKNYTQSVSEGNVAKIMVKSSVETENSLSVGFTVTDVRGDFFDATSSDSSPKSMTFIPAGKEFIDELKIGTRVNNAFDHDSGKIRIELESPQATDGYTIDDTAKTTSISVLDQSIHLISISSERDSVTEGDNTTFVINSTPPQSKDFDVYLSVFQRGDYLIWPVKNVVRFKSGVETYTIELNTFDDDVVESDGSVTVAILASASDGYLLDTTRNSATVVVVDNDSPAATSLTRYSVVSSIIRKLIPEPPKPVVSIATSYSEVPDSDFFNVTVSIDTPPGIGKTLPVILNVTNSDDTTSTVAANSTVSVTFVRGETSKDVRIDLKEGQLTDSNNGDRIKVTPQSSSKYDINTIPMMQSASVLVVDSTSLPTIDLTAPTSAEEGEQITVTLTASKAAGSGKSYRVRLLGIDTGTVDGYYGILTGSPVLITNPKTIETVTVTTNEDSTYRGDGEITLRISPGVGYKLGKATAVVTVIEDDTPEILPEVTITAISGTTFGITESHSFEYTLNRTGSTTEVLRVSVEVSALGTDASRIILTDDDNGIAIPRTAYHVTIPRNKSSITKSVNVEGDINSTDTSIKVTVLQSTSPKTYNVQSGNNSVTIDVKDNDSPTANNPRLSIEGPIGNLQAGVDAVFIIRSTHVHTPSSFVTVWIVVSESGGYLGTTTGLFETESYVTNVQSYKLESMTGTIRIPTVDPNSSLKDPDGRITVTIQESFRYSRADYPMHLAEAIITDAKVTEAEQIYINRSRDIMESETATFTIMSNDNTSDTEVYISVSQVGSYIFLPIPNSVHLARGRYTLNIPTLDNREDDEGGSITLRIIPNSEYEIRTGEGIKIVNVSDDEVDGITDTTTTYYSVVSNVISSILLAIPETLPTPPPIRNVPVISIVANFNTIIEGEVAMFTLTASQTVSSRIEINVKLRETEDFIVDATKTTAIIEQGNTSTTLSIQTVDDEKAEKDGSIQAVIIEGIGYVIGAEDRANVVVSDALDRQTRKVILDEANLDAMSLFAGSLGSHALNTATHRVSNAFAEGRDMSVELFGNSTITELLHAGIETINQGKESWQKVLGESSFELGLFPEAGATNPATVWGLGDYRSLGFNNTVDGDIFNGYLGLDALVGERATFGLATSISHSEMKYESGNDFVTYQSHLTGIHPYIGVESDSGDRLQIIAGYGQGEIELDQEGYETEILDSRLFSFGVGGEVKLYSSENFLNGGNSELSINGQSWIASQFVSSRSDAVSNLRADGRYLRVTAQGTHRHAFEHGATITPEVSIGLREDGMKRNSFLGMELGGGLGYNNNYGYKINSKGGMLLSDTSKVQEWGISGKLTYDSYSDRLGLLLDVAPAWRHSWITEDSALWDNNILDHEFNYSLYKRSSKVDAEFGYGINIWDGISVFTPYGGFKLARDNDDGIRVGSKLSIGTDIEFELVGSRTFQNNAITENEINLNSNIKW